MSGAELGSQELTFHPRTVKPGTYHFDIGTAGSTTLVLQSVLPALMLADRPSVLILNGGTHNPLAPTYDFLTGAYLPILRRMGPRVDASLERAGYYPKGDGRIRVAIEPVPRLTAIHLNERGPIHSIRATATVAGLPRHIAERELKVIREGLNLRPTQLEVHVESADRGPANVLTVELTSQHVTEIVTGFGERGVSAETVAARSVTASRRYIAAGVAIGEHLADQLLLPMALARAGSFTTLRPTPHTTTNRRIIGHFLDTTIALRQLKEDIWRIACSP